MNTWAHLAALPKVQPGDRQLTSILQRCGSNPCGCARERNDNEPLSRSAITPGDSREKRVPPIVHHALRSSGQPLTGGERALFESRFGHDFSEVRLHTGRIADESARTVAARAYTVGHDIVFAEGRYPPSSGAGWRLLAHELTHVVQQRHGAGSAGAEERADAAADRIARGQDVSSAAVGTAAVGVQRDDNAEAAGPRLAGRKPPRLLSDRDTLSLGVTSLDRFDHNSAVLSPEHDASIVGLAQRIVALLSSMPGGTVTITGHTDLTGDEAHNAELGHRRAAAVRDALVRAGVPALSIEVRTAGATDPVVDTREREPRNRRVDVRFRGNPPSTEPSSLLLAPGRGPGFAQPPIVDPTKFPAMSSQSTLFSGPSVPGPQRLFDPKRIDSPARPARVADALKGVATTPVVKRFLEDAARKSIGEIKKLPTGEKVLLGSAIVTIGSGALAGIASDPEARKEVLDLIDGQVIPVPGVEGLGVQILTKGGGGAVIQLDLIKILAGPK